LEEPVSSEAIRVLGKWIGESRSSRRQLSRKAAERLEALLQERNASLPLELRSEIASILGFWRRL
jgi:hypothetical protein